MEPKRTKLNIEVASAVAERYCIENKLSISKLKEQKIVDFQSSIVFAQPTMTTQNSVYKTGLRKDKGTQPKPTLVLRRTPGGYAVEETEFTNKYLK